MQEALLSSTPTKAKQNFDNNFTFDYNYSYNYNDNSYIYPFMYKMKIYSIETSAPIYIFCEEVVESCYVETY